MIARCKNCNHCEWFDPNDEFGIKLKLKDQKCECGGSFQKMYSTNDENRYVNHRGDSWELTAIGEFRIYKNEKL